MGAIVIITDAESDKQLKELAEKLELPFDDITNKPFLKVKITSNRNN